MITPALAALRRERRTGARDLARIAVEHQLEVIGAGIVGGDLAVERLGIVAEGGDRLGAAHPPGADVIGICEAIRFMTGTEPKVALDTTRMRYLITSEGTRNGPCGP